MNVPKLSFYTIDFHARQTLERIQPDMLTRPDKLDVEGLWQWGLGLLGADRDVGTPELMEDAEAWTEWFDNEPFVLLRQDQRDALGSDTEPELRARANIAHETGHVVLHTRWAGAQNRADWSPDSKDMPMGCEEWQAWAFAGCLLMPCDVVRGLQRLDPLFVSDIFQVSPQMVRCHLFRMKRAGML